MKVDRFAVTADPNGTGQAKSKKVWPVPLEKHLDTSKLESKHMKVYLQITGNEKRQLVVDAWET